VIVADASSLEARLTEDSVGQSGRIVAVPVVRKRDRTLAGLRHLDDVLAGHRPAVLLEQPAGRLLVEDHHSDSAAGTPEAAGECSVEYLDVVRARLGVQEALGRAHPRVAEKRLYEVGAGLARDQRPGGVAQDARYGV
jgi:hypothetical protein